MVHIGPLILAHGLADTTRLGGDAPGSLVLAHGLGERLDLPIPVALAQYAAAAVLVATFWLLGALWRKPRYEQDGGIALPRLEQAADARVTRAVLRGLGLLLLFLTLVTALAGSGSSARNPAPTWFFVWFWVGLVPASVLLGPVWRLLDPLPALSAAARGIAGRRTTVAAYPRRLGRWPAALGLLVFTWLELVVPDRDRPSTVATFIVVYVVIHVAGGLRYGASWHDHADAFGAYSACLGRLSPLGRNRYGQIVLSNPLRNLARSPEGPGALAVVVVLLGSTAFDGITRTQVWTGWTSNLNIFPSLVAGTAGLVGAIALIAVTFRFAVRVSEALVRPESRNSGSAALARRFTVSLVPILAGYTTAHYFSLLVFQGQAGYLLATDPLARGWDLFGTAGQAIDYDAVSSGTIAAIQVAAIVTGHMVGVLAAHDRAVGLFSEAEQRKGQYPLIAVMIAYTMAGIGLLVA